MILNSSVEADYTTEAIALHDFTARSNKEISFNKGDKIKIYTRTTPDWWDAKVDGKYGYVPVSYIKIIENSSPASAPPAKLTLGTTNGENHPTNATELKKEWKKSHEQSKQLDRVDGGNPPKNPPKNFTAEKQGSGDEEEEPCGNVFAAIDPTCSVETTAAGAGGPLMKRVGSERSPRLQPRDAASPTHRTQSDKRDVKPRVVISQQQQQAASDLDSSTDDSPTNPPQHTLPKVNATPNIVGTGTYPPPGGGGGGAVKCATNPMFVVSQQDLFTNKLRSTSDSTEEKKSSDGGARISSSEVDISRERPMSVKDKSKVFGSSSTSSIPSSGGAGDRPQSQVIRPVVLGHMQIESADRPSPVPNFKPPPPPALKPKPSVRKKENGSQTSLVSKDDNTRL